jgi:FkbM family methyltransferase
VNITIRKILTASGPSRRLYYAAREAYHTRRVSKVAGSYFLNANEFKHALGGHGAVTTPFDLRTSDGLTITIRRNYGDAMTVAEIFMDNCYVRDLAPPHSYPVVIDIGGFIGDFSLYAVKRLGARRVIVCEPSPRNWALLLKNIANNHYEDRIEPVNMAVTDGEEVMMNVAAPDESQCMVSAYCQDGQPMQAVPGISLSQLLQDHSVDAVDLLKIDCEGGEYPILLNTPSEVYSRIRNIVFEYHDIEGGWAKLEQVKKRLHEEGYSLRTGRGLVSASRA